MADELLENSIFETPGYSDDSSNPQSSDVDVEGSPIPLKHEPGWKDYILTQFLDSEMEGGNPTVAGLRRVTEKVLGSIIGGHPDVKQCPSIDNNQRATVIYTITIRGIDGVMTFGGAADASMSNIDDKMFQRYPVAMAETRAESRAYRHALGLYGICAAEEIDNNPAVTTEFKAVQTNGEEGITQTQVSLMNIMCGNTARGLDINVDKFASAEEKKEVRMIDITSERAKELLKKLSSFQADKTQIPETIKGFDKAWSNR